MVTVVQRSILPHRQRPRASRLLPVLLLLALRPWTSRAAFCCSQTFAACLDVVDDGTEWCNTNADNCVVCSGLWVDAATAFEDADACIPRWDVACQADSDCCGPAICHDRGDWTQCEVAEDDDATDIDDACCSYDQKTCHVYDDTDALWCHEQATNCETCAGHWIDPAATQTCTGRWQYCDAAAETCCGDTVCIDNACERPMCCVDGNTGECMEGDDASSCHFSSSNCDACGGSWQNRLDIIIGVPVEDEEAPDSVVGAVDLPPPPTVVRPPPPPQPQLPPAQSNPAPTGEFVPAGYSERIVIPEPSTPVLQEGNSRTSCPHDSTGLVDWNDATTWPSGAVPTEGEDVVLPDNSRVVLGQSPGSRFGLITIPASSALIVGENDAGVDLDVTGIDVQGELILGSETCRLETAVTITLHGARPNDVSTVPAETYKGISVTGKLQLHGKRFFRTWTRLAKSANPGETQLFLQHAVNWEPGQEVVVVTTAMKDSREWHQNEVHTITSVDTTRGNVGSVVSLGSAIQHPHIGTSNYQAEVGLLSRTIVIQGSEDDSEPTDPDPLNCVGEFDRFGDTSSPCPYTEITGFGGHVIVHKGGKGYVEGVEFFRMGMTNMVGRYPIHFHLLDDSCLDCYVEASSFHHSFYRCAAIHGTNGMRVSENVAYDITGYCYYLEDGVEQDNTISFNLAAFIHSIGPDRPSGYGQNTEVYTENDRLALPADVTASGFYITNLYNNIIGNSASGGWAGFAVPILPTALQTFRGLNFRPSSVSSLVFDGNTAHSTGWWWGHAGAFYFGGALYYTADGLLEYNPGRSFDFENQSRRPCNVNPCEVGGCSYGCPSTEEAFVRISNSKTFQVSGTGFNSWSGTMEVIGYEAHDVGLSLESLSEGFWIDNMLATCRTGQKLGLPPSASATSIVGDGFFWYDTAQEHIISRTTFRNCGYRSDELAQYDESPDRGCGSDVSYGCHPRSTVFGMLAHSDEFTPEIMQGTAQLSFESCGRRFYLSDFAGVYDTVSGRGQNWLDSDGTASGLGEPVMVVSGLDSAKNWLEVDDYVVFDEQGPLRFIRNNLGPERGIGHFRMVWDSALSDGVGSSFCGNGNGLPCPSVGNVRHAGSRFEGLPGLPLTARGEVAGPVGGFGWVVEFDAGSPRQIDFEQIEVLPETPMLVSIAYPVGTTFTISAHANPWCNEGDSSISCSETFQAVDSIARVRTGPGNEYFVDADGVVTFRIVQTPHNFVGQPEWFIPSRDDVAVDGSGAALDHFTRAGVFLPRHSYFTFYRLVADCGGTGTYCNGNIAVTANRRDVCASGFEQTAYDQCCSVTDKTQCLFANGATSFLQTFSSSSSAVFYHGFCIIFMVAASVLMF